MVHTCNTCKHYKRLKNGYTYCRLSMLHIGEWQNERKKHCDNWENFCDKRSDK